jgi:hypothetical protein
MFNQELAMKKKVMFVLLVLVALSCLASAQSVELEIKENRNDFFNIWVGGGLSAISPWTSSGEHSAYAGDGYYWPYIDSDEMYVEWDREFEFSSIPFAGGVEMRRGKFYLRGELQYAKLSATTDTSITAGAANYGTSWMSITDDYEEEVDANLLMMDFAVGFNMSDFSIFAGVANLSTGVKTDSEVVSFENISFVGVGGGLSYANYSSEKLFFKGTASYYMNPGWVEPELTEETVNGDPDEIAFSFNRDQFYDYAILAGGEIGYFITQKLYASLGFSSMILHDGIAGNSVMQEVIVNRTEYDMSIDEDLSMSNNSVFVKIGLVIF